MYLHDHLKQVNISSLQTDLLGLYRVSVYVWVMATNS